MSDARERLDRDRAAYLRACELDVVVAKPGNVSVASAGHGMDAAMFAEAARVTAGPLFAQRASVGARIENAVDAACAATGCNTNLGIILLCAPLAAALEQQPDGRTSASVRAAVADVLDRLDIGDAHAAFRAIAAANPGGLGHAPEQDVRGVPTVDLRTAMCAAAGRDSIARQYSNGFADIFDFGLPRFERAAHRSDESAVLATYLAFLATWPDSHVARRHGDATARALSREAAQHTGDGHPGAPLPGVAALEAWDVALKSRGINPGTSADLVVATVFVVEALRGFA